jgi:hypothetical protein
MFALRVMVSFIFVWENSSVDEMQMKNAKSCFIVEAFLALIAVKILFVPLFRRTKRLKRIAGLAPDCHVVPSCNDSG